MAMQTRGLNQSEQILDELVVSCNDIQSTLHDSATVPIHHDRSGPLWWRESCDKVIAVARDVLQFRMIIELAQVADESDVVRATLSRTLPGNLMFDRLESVFMDGRPVKPTSHSLNRRVDLDFHRIESGSIVVVTYQVRVDFNAETTKVVVGDTNIDWSWVSRSELTVVDRPHVASQQIAAPHRLAPHRSGSQRLVTSNVLR